MNIQPDVKNEYEKWIRKINMKNEYDKWIWLMNMINEYKKWKTNDEYTARCEKWIWKMNMIDEFTARWRMNIKMNM